MAENENMIQVPEAQFQALVDRINKLEKGTSVSKPIRVVERTATMRILDGRPVIGLATPYTTRDKFNQEIMYVDITVKGDEENETFKVEYLDFLNNCPKAQVSIIKQVAHEKREVFGKFTAHNRDETFNKRWSPEEVEEVVVSVDYEATVEFLEGALVGKQITVSTKALNI